VSFASTTASVCTVNGATATFLAAGTCSITASQAGNSTYAAATPVAQSFTVNAAPLTAQTISFANPGAQTVGTPLALTATATSGLTVSFASTTASVCTVNGATATFLAAGTCSITASQAGNSTYAAAAPVAQSFTVNAGATPDFSINASNTSATVIPGFPVSFTFTVTPLNATTIPAAVNFSISGLPPGATAVFSPNSIAAGSGATTMTLTIQTAQMASAEQPGAAQPGGNLASRIAPFSLALLLLPFAGRLRKTGRRLSRFMAVVLLLSAGAAAMAGLSGCVSNTGFFTQPQHSYTVTVTGVSGSLSHTSNVTLTVE
jgi:hypothetical protein